MRSRLVRQRPVGRGQHAVRARVPDTLALGAPAVGAASSGRHARADAETSTGSHARPDPRADAGTPGARSGTGARSDAGPDADQGARPRADPAAAARARPVAAAVAAATPGLPWPRPALSLVTLVAVTAGSPTSRPCHHFVRIPYDPGSPGPREVMVD
jgi:hypothetical protein